MTEVSESVPVAPIRRSGLEDMQISNIKLQREVQTINKKYTRLLKSTV